MHSCTSYGRPPDTHQHEHFEDFKIMKTVCSSSTISRAGGRQHHEHAPNPLEIPLFRNSLGLLFEVSLYPLLLLSLAFLNHMNQLPQEMP